MTEIAVDILLELEAVDDDRVRPFIGLVRCGRRGIGRLNRNVGGIAGRRGRRARARWSGHGGGSGGIRFLVGVGILHDERQRFAVGCPSDVRDRPAQAWQTPRLAAEPVEQPQLILVMLVAPARNKGKPATVGAPARGRLAFLGAAGQLHAVLAVPAGHPQMAETLVGGHIRFGDRISDPRAGRIDLRIGDGFDPRDIVGPDRMARWCRGGRNESDERRGGKSTADGHDGIPPVNFAHLCRFVSREQWPPVAL